MLLSDFIIIWNEELTFFMKRSALKPSDQEILAQFGRNLGQHTLTQQQKHIQLALSHLESQLEEAEEQKNSKYDEKFRHFNRIVHRDFADIRKEIVMLIDAPILFQIAGIGVIIALITTILKQMGKEDIAQFASLIGFIIVLFICSSIR